MGWEQYQCTSLFWRTSVFNFHFAFRILSEFSVFVRKRFLMLHTFSWNLIIIHSGVLDTVNYDLEKKYIYIYALQIDVLVNAFSFIYKSHLVLIVRVLQNYVCNALFALNKNANAFAMFRKMPNKMSTKIAYFKLHFPRRDL